MSIDFRWNYHKNFPIAINMNSLVSLLTCLSRYFP